MCGRLRGQGMWDMFSEVIESFDVASFIVA